jgi:penicillin amidase
MADETLSLPGLEAGVTVQFDNLGIPSITAQSLHDLAFAQGYLHARDRLWQMDVNRRQASGRMAELFGKGHVNGDYQKHLAMIPEVAQQVWDERTPEESELYEAYSGGVNAYIETIKQLPAEYEAIGATPAPWTPLDSMAIGRGMSWGMSSDIGMEVMFGVLAKTMGVSALLKLLPIYGLDPITIQGDMEISSFPEQDFHAGIAAHMDQPFYTTGRIYMDRVFGSNNWVVSGKRTDTGAPMLANDTHMGFDNPCIWYEINLMAPDLHVAGLSVPGAPGILIGHNERVAWGITQARYDVADAYVEKLDPERPDTHYMYKGESVPFEKQAVSIQYKAEDGTLATEERTVLRTVHGPVIYEEDRPRTVLSFRWTGHVPTHEPMFFFGAMKARDVEDFKAALDWFEVGAINVVYADIDGNIYYRSQGKVPIRKGKPFLPLEGWNGDYEWQGYIPYNELPQATNPDQGFIATANNRQAGADYPYYIGAIYDKGYRARRITDMILAAQPMTMDTMRDMQLDVYSLPAENMLPLLYAAAEAHPELITPQAADALALLKKWDRRDLRDAVEPSIFYTWIKLCTINIFKDNLPGEVFGHIGRSEVVYPVLIQDKKWPMDFFDDTATSDVRETKDMMLAKSLSDAVAALTEQLGPDPAAWTWGSIHKVSMHHQLGGDWKIGPEPGDGGTDSINVGGFGLTGDFNYGGGPNMRFSVDLSPDGLRARNVIVGGQTGGKNSPHYDDQFRMWLAGETHPIWFTKQDVDSNTAQTLILKP